LVCLSEGRGSWFDWKPGELSSSSETLSLGLSRSTLDCCLDHTMVCMDCPGVDQLHIVEAVPEGGRSHDVISSGSEHCLEGSIRVVPLLVPGLLVSEPPSRVEVLKHVFHAIGSQKVWWVLKSGDGECRSTFKSAISIGGHLFLNRSKAACRWWRSSRVSGSKQVAVTGWRVPPNKAWHERQLGPWRWKDSMSWLGFPCPFLDSVLHAMATPPWCLELAMVAATWCPLQRRAWMQ